MHPREQLRHTLARIDGRPYGAYRDLVGRYDFGSFRLHVEHVQPDPFAPPSRIRVEVPPARAGLAPEDWRDPLRRRGLEDWLLRRLAQALDREADAAAARRPALRPGESTPPPRPIESGAALPGGCLHVLVPGQQVLERSALSARRGAISARLQCDLPAQRRSVHGGRAAAALDVALPAAVAAMFPRHATDEADLRAHLELLEDQGALRAEIERRGWVAFVADGSVLPRASGISDLPLGGGEAVRFRAPDDLAETVELPHRGAVRGLPVREGVTLIVGGAYHGKSTLLRALERGVYDHVAGDGRELCVTRADAVTVAAEDGRAARGVDISAFVRPLPGGVPTTAFSTRSASGSTSQASALCEALEQGARCLLVDEDRSAANFMSRDVRMRALVPDAEDPVVPLADRVRWLWTGLGVSSVLVVGGAGAFLGVADQVLRMREYQPEDATARAAEVARRWPWPEAAAAPAERPAPRVPAADALVAGLGPDGRVRARVRGRGLLLGEEPVDLRAQTQIVEEAQLHALADMLALAAAWCDERRTVAEVVTEVSAEVERLGLEALSPWAGQCPGTYARPRPQELAAAINRVPGLRMAGDPPRAPGEVRAPARRSVRRTPAERPARPTPERPAARPGPDPGQRNAKPRPKPAPSEPRPTRPLRPKAGTMQSFGPAQSGGGAGDVRAQAAKKRPRR